MLVFWHSEQFINTQTFFWYFCINFYNANICFLNQIWKSKHFFWNFEQICKSSSIFQIRSKKGKKRKEKQTNKKRTDKGGNSEKRPVHWSLFTRVASDEPMTTGLQGLIPHTTISFSVNFSCFRVTVGRLSQAASCAWRCLFDTTLRTYGKNPIWRWLRRKLIMSTTHKGRIPRHEKWAGPLHHRKQPVSVFFFYCFLAFILYFFFFSVSFLFIFHLFVFPSLLIVLFYFSHDRNMFKIFKKCSHLKKIKI